MTDPVSLAAPAADVAATGAARAAPAAQRLDPAETRMFARLMQGAAPVESTGPGTLRDAAMAYASQLTGNSRSYEEIRRGMLESIDLSDPIKTMFALTDQSMQAHMMFAKLHISTGLASAATSLFGTLLRNQQ